MSQDKVLIAWLTMKHEPVFVFNQSVEGTENSTAEPAPQSQHHWQSLSLPAFGDTTSGNRPKARWLRWGLRSSPGAG